MITNPMAHEKDQLIRDIYKSQKQVAETLLKKDNQQNISQLILEWHALKDFFVKNTDLAKISLEELKEKHNQVIELLEKAKNADSI